MSKTRADNGDLVKVHFVGKLENGTVFDTTENGPPLEFTIGDGNIIPGFEQGVNGMEINEKKTINVPPDLGYGPADEKKIFKVRRNYFSHEYPPAIGLQLKYAPKKVEPIYVVVTDLDDDSVTLDGNHALAGKTLIFDLELVEIG
ncbi:MAG: peptidylprolyl isomerase [Deltaproteobacteria bacterium]|nr:peptidylprolyl isomerase [Deltaproteobacteria bacterium]